MTGVQTCALPILPHEHPHKGALAGPVRAEQGDHLPTGHGEADVVYGDEGSEHPFEFTGFDGRRCPHGLKTLSHPRFQVLISTLKMALYWFKLWTFSTIQQMNQTSRTLCHDFAADGFAY